MKSVELGSIPFLSRFGTWKCYQLPIVCVVDSGTASSNTSPLDWRVLVLTWKALQRFTLIIFNVKRELLTGCGGVWGGREKMRTGPNESLSQVGFPHFRRVPDRIWLIWPWSIHIGLLISLRPVTCNNPSEVVLQWRPPSRSHRRPGSVPSSGAPCGRNYRRGPLINIRIDMSERSPNHF